jgi:hypothetical protein
MSTPVTTFEPPDAPAIVDDTFDALTALEKRDFLFDHGIRPTAYVHGLPDTHLGVTQFTESAVESFAEQLLRDTITRVGDELGTPKHKLFHTYGTTAKIRFTPADDTPYSGIFQDSAPGLLRFSYAGPMIAVGIVPGLGLKFPIDGAHPSENAVLMRGLDRQSGPSVFAHPFSNLLPDPSPLNVIMRIVKERFESVVETGHGLHQPVDNLARIHVDGSLVADPQVRAPYRLILAPTPGAVQATAGAGDFRITLARDIATGARIYEVFALDASEDAALGDVPLEDRLGQARRIGSLSTESPFIASAYGDFRLFFKHHPAFLRRT